MRILLFSSPELYVHYLVLYYGYIYHSLYVVIIWIFVEASCGSGMGHDHTLPYEGRPRSQPDGEVVYRIPPLGYS
jgi:hypothetical protein